MNDKCCQECGCTRRVPVDVGPIREPGVDIIYRCVCCDALLAPAGYRIYPEIIFERKKNG